MGNIDVHMWSVLVGGIVSMIIGATWYNPKVFGNAWMQASGTRPNPEMAKKGMGKSYLINFVGALVMAYVMAHFATALGLHTFWAGMQLGFWIWLGFVATSFLGSVLWEMKSWKYYALTSGYYLVSFVIVGGILAAWM